MAWIYGARDQATFSVTALTKQLREVNQPLLPDSAGSIILTLIRNFSFTSTKQSTGAIKPVTFAVMMITKDTRGSSNLRLVCGMVLLEIPLIRI